MSETPLAELQKKRTELENHWSSLLQKEKNLKEDVKTLEEKVQAQLESKIKATDVALETLGSKKSDLEKRLKELQEQAGSSQMPNEPWKQSAEINEVTPKQPVEMTAKPAVDSVQVETEESKDKHKDEKKRSKWM
jgi:chaperonin cofactor prefoldin